MCCLCGLGCVIVSLLAFMFHVSLFVCEFVCLFECACLVVCVCVFVGNVVCVTLVCVGLVLFHVGVCPQMWNRSRAWCYVCGCVFST